MLRDFTWTEKYEEAMSDEHPLDVRLGSKYISEVFYMFCVLLSDTQLLLYSISTEIFFRVGYIHFMMFLYLLKIFLNFLTFWYLLNN